MPPDYQVYVLENTDRRHYVGLSEDVGKRLEQHNAGLSRWSAKYRPWRLIWTSDVLPLGDARKLENLLKRQKGGAGLYRLIGQPKPNSPGS